MSNNSTHQSMIVSAETKISSARSGDHITIWLAGGNNTMQITFYDADTLQALADAVSGDVAAEFIADARVDSARVPCPTCGNVACQVPF